MLSISNSAHAHGEDAIGFIFLQLIGFIFVIVMTLFFVKNWKYRLIVIFSSLPIGIFLDLIPSNFTNQLFGNHELFAVFATTVIPSMVLMFVYRAKVHMPSKNLSEPINSIPDSKTITLKAAISTTLQLLVLLPILIATVATIMCIADSIYVTNTSRAFNKIELKTSENTVISLMGKPSNTTNCAYNISTKNNAYVLPGNDSENYKDCIIEAYYESFFHGWAIGYTVGTNVISKYEYLLNKPNLSFRP